MKKWFLLLLVGLFINTARHLSARDVLVPVDTAPSALSAANQANELVKKGDLEGARRLYDIAIHADPKLYLAMYFRGEISMQQHKWEPAIQDFNAVLKISPGFFLAAIKRGDANKQLGRYELSLADYDKVLTLHPMVGSRGRAKTSRAWLRATCPNAAFRNGQQAVEDAKAACNLCDWREWDYIDTLAAAYAETGDFDSAIKFEQRAISKAKKDANTKGAQQRLALYQQHKPYRDGN
jgi:tetratricopeptide (TPR) repeat protein